MNYPKSIPPRDMSIDAWMCFGGCSQRPREVVSKGDIVACIWNRNTCSETSLKLSHVGLRPVGVVAAVPLMSNG